MDVIFEACLRASLLKIYVLSGENFFNSDQQTNFLKLLQKNS